MTLQEQWIELRQRDGGSSEWPVYTKSCCVGFVYRFKHSDKPKEWWVVEVDNNGKPTAIKRICQ